MDVVPRLIPKIFEIGGDAEIAAAHELKSRIHRCLLVVLFNFAKAHGWLRPLQQTAADALGPCKVKERDVAIYTPPEGALVRRGGRGFCSPTSFCSPSRACGGKSCTRVSRGNQSNFERGTILVSAGIAKTGRKRKIDLAQNALAWLAPYRGKRGPIFKADPRKRMAKVSAVSRVK